MAGVVTDGSSPRDFSSSGQVVGIVKKIAMKKLCIESKVFYLSAKENDIGVYITVTEKTKTETQMYQVPAEPGKKYEKCLFLTQSSANKCADLLKEFWEISSRSNSFETIQDDSKMKSFTEGRRTYCVELKENGRGQYLKVCCKQEGHLARIAIPFSGVMKVHECIADLIKNVWPPSVSLEHAIAVDGHTSMSQHSNTTADSDANPNKESPENFVGKSAAKQRKSQQQTTSTEKPGPASVLFVAVQLRMSMRRNHLEAQVLTDSSKEVLRKWQEAWKKRTSSMPRQDMKQETSAELGTTDKEKGKRKRSYKRNMTNEWNQPDMPEPEPVILPGFSNNDRVLARLTSCARGSDEFINHESRKSTSYRQPHGYKPRNPHTWVFRLSDKPRLDNRQFFLHLHKAMPATTHSDETWGDEICKAFIFPDQQGSCFLSHLGFTKDNQPAQRRSGSGDFSRTEKPGDVMSIATLKQTMKYHECIIDFSQSVGWISGPISGTGFCIGNDEEKFVMTCNHIFQGYDEEFLCGQFSISFSNSEGGETSFVLRSFVSKDVKLDYAILTLDDPTKAPKPIPCDSIDVGNHQYLTIIGYRQKGDLAFDSRVEQQMFSLESIALVKHFVRSQWSQLPSHDYDEIGQLAPDLILYNVASHKHGSSGSPVLLFQDGSLKLVAVHRRGFPNFYYNEETRDMAQNMIPNDYAVEAGTRLSSILAHLRATLNSRLELDSME